MLAKINDNKHLVAVLAAFMVLAAVAVAILFLVKPALGTDTNIQPNNIVGIGQDQGQVNEAAKYTAAEAEHINMELVDKISEPTPRENIDLIDPEELKKKIEEKNKAAEAQRLAEQKAEEARIAAQKEAEAAKKAAEEKAAAEKEAAEQKAAQAAAQAVQEAKAAQAAKEQAEITESEALQTVAYAQTTDSGWESVTASVYHNVGEKTATGDILSAEDMIIAHKTLPLGTQVEISYNGNTVIATVGDRGPYVQGREIDLAPAVQEALGVYDGVTEMQMRVIA
ncbi:MAG: septal ring lytic transglycosylase RlpA family protein [Coriobacteriia bacterium]|nr:septal ring lytic transglycosylase RlpA family protein [Coriobacteriia bacterium]